MKMVFRILLLILGLALTMTLAGCPGLPGASGGGSQQNVPPGLQPPPGETSGGARTLMGTTITARENSVLLIQYAYGTPAQPAPWQSCRRVIPLESAVIIEGLNYDGRGKAADKDVNQILPLVGLTFFWKYEPKPAPPPQPASKQGRPGAGPEQAPPSRQGR